MWDWTWDHNKRPSKINIVSTYELSSNTKSWMCVYKESVHSNDVWIKLNTSTRDMKENKIRTETEWFQHFFRFQNLPMRKHYSFMISYYALSQLSIYLYVFIYGSFCPKCFMGWSVFVLWVQHIIWYCP